MKKSLIVLILAAAFLLGGCTMTETHSARWQRISAAQQVQMRMMVEDIDYVLLLDQPSRLTPWAVRGGLPY